MNAVTLESVLSCPVCGHARAEIMPTDACQWLYQCEQCHSVLRPKPGDCCVYCSYGTVPCPPVQLSQEHGAEKIRASEKMCNTQGQGCGQWQGHDPG